MKLYGYWRSSAAFRLRIALNLKQLDYEQVAVNIAPISSEQLGDTFRAINPQMRVPVLEAEGEILLQSMAILEWLEEAYPSISILPTARLDRQRARAFADIIACDIHPLNNLSVLKVLRERFAADDAAIASWYADWIIRGFVALEKMAAGAGQTPFLFGDAPSIAEICLIPQMWNARRFKVDLSGFPHLCAIDAACHELDAFQRAAPDQQADAG